MSDDINNDPLFTISLATAETVPLDVALDKICQEMGLTHRPGGASARGWSMRSTLMACPYKYKKLFLEVPEGTIGASAVALETGGLYHQLMAFRYMQMLEDKGGLTSPVDYDWFKARLLEEKVAAEVVMNAFRLFDAYCYQYESDYIVPLAVEIEGEDKFRNTCRYDTIVRVEANDLILPGTYILEHKTASRFDTVTLEQWKNDGQLLGQVHIYYNMKLYKKYGDLVGIIVNLVSKTKTPDFRRIVVAPDKKQVAGHVRDLKIWESLEALFNSTGCWPRSRSACRGPYGLCVLSDHCAEG